jgi:transposase
MPWRETCYIDERARFAAELLAEEESMSELCERYVVSRKTGYRCVPNGHQQHLLEQHRPSGPRRRRLW